MKNRFISVLTVVAVFVQALCFSTGALAWDTVTAEVPYSDRATEIFDSLQISNFMSPDTPSVTRIRFLATLMSLIGYDKLTPGGKSSFSDVKGEFSGMLDYACDLKLVSKGDTFRPDDAITYSEAMKMSLVLAGYEYECAASGGYPVGVMSVGYRLKLNKNIALSQNSPLTYDDAMTLIYNLMNVRVVNVVSVGADVDEPKFGLAPSEESLLEIYHGVHRITGVVTENSRTSLYASKSGTRSSVEINLTDYYCDKKYEDLIGHNVVAFVSDEKSEAISVFSEDNEIMAISGDDVIGFGEGKVVFRNENDKKRNAALKNDYDVLYNGKAYTKNLSYEFLSDCEYISFIDNDRDAVYDIISVTDVSYTLVDKVNYVEKVIYTHSEVGKNIDMSSVKGQYTISDKDGKEISIYNVEADMLLEAAVSEDGLYAMVKESANVVNAAITSSDFENLVFELDGVEYKMTKDFRNAFSSLSVGTKGNFYIGKNGKAVMYKKGSTRLQYGYIMKAGKKTAMGGYQVKILGETGVISVLDFADKVIVDSGVKTAYEAYGIIQNDLVTNLVRFRTDDDGKLKVLDTAAKDIRTGEAAIGSLTEDSQEDDDSLVMYFSDYTGGYTYKDSPKALQPKVNVASTRIFTTPVNPEDIDDETKYRVVRSNNFRNDQSFTSDEIEIFDVDKYGNCSVILYKGDITKTAVEDSQSAVIERIRYELNSEGVFEKCLRLLVNGKYESYFIGKDINEEEVKGGKPLCKGDIIRFKAENDTLLSILVDFDSSASVMAKTSDIPDDRFNAGNQKYHYQAGRIYSINDKIAYFDLDSEVKSSAPTPINKRVFSFEWNNLNNFSIPKGNIVKVKIYGEEKDGIFTERDREVSIADLSEVESYLEKGKDADYAVLRQNAFEGRLLVIYKFEN